MRSRRAAAAAVTTGEAASSCTIYSSLPLQGASRVRRRRPSSTASKLALEQAGGKAGDLTDQVQVARRLHRSGRSLDAGAGVRQRPQGRAGRQPRPSTSASSTRARARSRSRSSTRPASRRSRRPTRPSVSPPTSRAPSPGEPDKYYPAGDAHLRPHRPEGHDPGRRSGHGHEGGRLHQGPAAQRQGGLRRGPRPRTSRLAAKEQGLEVVSNEAIDKNAANYRSLAPKAKAPALTASSTRGITANNAVAALQGLRRGAAGREALRPGRRRRVRLRRSRRRAASRPSVGVAREGHGRDAVPGRATRRRARSSSRTSRRSTARTNPDPYAIYGYEAMHLALDAIERSEHRREGRRASRPLFATKDRASVLGTYSIDENGDTTLTDYGVYSSRTASSRSTRPSRQRPTKTLG